ncbi:MAG: hypothetical protein ABIP63_02400 [Thermoanaerobaculia bacterium]
MTAYEVLLSSALTPASVTTACSVAAAATGCTVSGLTPGAYTWLVRTKTTSCPSGFNSDVKQFFVGCPTVPAQLQTPPSGALDVPTTPAYTWTAVNAADRYDLYLGPLGAGCAGSPVATSSTNSFNLPALQPGTAYEWKVVSRRSGTSCPGVPSACSTFRTASLACAAPGNFSLTAPGNGSVTGTTPVLTWMAAAGATKYQLHLGTTNPPPAVATDPLIDGSSTSYTPSPLPPGKYFWSVDAFASCSTTLRTASPVSSFTVQSACLANAASLISPSNKATAVSSPVLFRWSAVSGAIGYKLFTSSGNTAGDLAGFTSDTTLTRLVPDGAVNWWVDTVFAGCPEVRSAIFQFTAGSPSVCGGGSIALTKPAAGALVTSPVALAWSAVPGATSYRVWMSFDGQSAEVISRTNDTTASIPLPSATVEWYVEAQFSNCPSIFSPHARFTVAKGAACDLHKPVALVAPVNGVKALGPVDFQWTAADPATFYRVMVSLDREPFSPVGVTRATHLSTDLSPGDVRWYVESLFDGCPPVVSATAQFILAPPPCGAGVPTLISPQPGAANVTAPVVLVWSAVPGAIEYRVLASLDGGDMVVIDKTPETTSTRPLPPGSYVWQVVAVFDGCSAGKSARSQFTVPRSGICGFEIPQLTAPADGAASITSPVTLSWNAVSGSVGYAVFVRHADGARTRLADTRDTQLTWHLPDGPIEWWVLALFQSCPSTESKHSIFTIPVRDACDRRPPLLVGPEQGAVSLVSPVTFSWTPVPRAASYKVWASVDGQEPSVIGATTQSRLTASVPAGIVRWYVEASFDACPSLRSSIDSFSVLKSAPACSAPARPLVTAPAQVGSGTPFTVRWSAVANVSSYEVEESATADFSAVTPLITSDLSATFTHASGDSPQRWRYRVRGISNCGDERGRRSPAVSVVVLPEKPQASTSIEAGALASVSQTLFIPGQTPPVTFTARTDKPWATVTPTSGTIGPAGVTLTLISDATALKLGSNQTSVILNYAAGKAGSRGVTPVTTVPVSVSLVTPVSSGGKTSPPPDSMIVPIVGHAPGANGSQFQSDVRIANVSAQPAKYQLNLTLTGTDGTQSGQSTSVQVEPGATMALDDIMSNFFGITSDGSGATGSLEIRPLTSTAAAPASSSSTPSIQTVVSSRTFTTSALGTFSQQIPAISLSQFVEKSSDTAISGVLTLQHLVQSAAYRTNLGLVEGAGESANVLVRVFNLAGLELTSIPLSLMPGEHKQLNYFLSRYGIATTDARIEVEVTSSTGKVSAYASVVDNFTNDPLLVPGVVKTTAVATQPVIPSVADAVDGSARIRSDVRIFNSGPAAVTATLVFTPENNGGLPVTAAPLAIAAGEVRVLDDVINSLFGKSNLRGSIAITATPASPLIVSSRTYTQTGSGTYGQFVPAVTAADTSGLGERILQLVQLEQSGRYSTDIGVVETAGKPTTVEISVISSDSKVYPKTSFTLPANGTQRLALADFGLSSAYNVRVTVKILSGSGRVSAYGSVVDVQTRDTTFIPAQ